MDCSCSAFTFSNQYITEVERTRTLNQNVMANNMIWLVFVLIFYLLLQTNCNSANNCSSYCECGLYKGRNQASCRARNLINGYVEVPPAVEILILSHNNIMQLENDCFKNFTHLIEIDLAFNALQSIALDTFRPLRRVERIDLSYNRLESIDNRLFETNRRLHTLNLEGNKFMFMSNIPLIHSIPLRSLNLRNSQLNFLQIQFFTGLPQLQELDISHNLLIELNPTVFEFNSQLLKLNIMGNAWKCNQILKAVKELRARGVEVSFEDCESEKLEKFERLQMAPNAMIPHKWRQIYEEEEQEDEFLTDYAESINICQSSMPKKCLRYKACLQEIVTYLEQRLREYQESDQSGLYTNTELKLAFLLGIAIGLTSSIIILTGAFCFKACLDIKREVRTPAPRPPPRAQRRRANNNQVLVHVEPGADNFISRLFGRPARHQYYRAINQNTATLIRRLSRSNLFNNRQNSTDRSPTHNGFTTYMRPDTPPPSYATMHLDTAEPTHPT